MLCSTTFFNVGAYGEALGCFSFKMFADIVSKTAGNFHALGTGEKGFGYKVFSIHRIILGFIRQVSDFTHHNGTGSRSIYGGKFGNESFILKYIGSGILFMANPTPNANNSQFFIGMTKTESLGGKRGLWESKRRHELQGSSGAFWVQEWQNQQDDHNCQLQSPLNCWRLNHQTFCNSGEHPTPSAFNTP